VLRRAKVEAIRTRTEHGWWRRLLHAIPDITSHLLVHCRCDTVLFLVASAFRPGFVSEFISEPLLRASCSACVLRLWSK